MSRLRLLGIQPLWTFSPDYFGWVWGSSVCISVGRIPASTVSLDHSICFFNCRRYCQMVSQSVCRYIHSCPQNVRVPLASQPCQQVAFWRGVWGLCGQWAAQAADAGGPADQAGWVTPRADVSTWLLQYKCLEALLGADPEVSKTQVASGGLLSSGETDMEALGCCAV